MNFEFVELRLRSLAQAFSIFNFQFSIPFRGDDVALKNNKYQPTYVEGIRRYFFDYELDEDNKGIPQMSAYARKLGVTVRTLENWAKKHKAFGEAYEACLDKQQELLKQQQQQQSAFVFHRKVSFMRNYLPACISATASRTASAMYSSCSSDRP